MPDTPEALTEQPDFQRLLPWAKAFAELRHATTLEHLHFLMAVQYLHERGEWAWPPTHVEAIRMALGTTPLVPPGTTTLEPVARKMPLSFELKELIALGAGTSVADWILRAAKRVLGDRQIQAALDGVELELGPSTQATAPEQTVEVDWVQMPGAPELRPWFLKAAHLLKSTELDTSAVALGVVHGLQARALDSHVDLRHFCQGHADELKFWLEHSGRWEDGAAMTEPSDLASLTVSHALTKASESLATDFKAPNVLWKWVHCAIKDANDYARQLQVAYHEAGHAVAIHLLIPEAIYKTITIVPEKNSGGHVSHDRNDGFDQVYGNSLEQVMELAVMALAGRAAEERRFGKMRADSGATADMATATFQCWRAITLFGLDPVFGMLTPAILTVKPPDDPRFMPIASSGWLHDLAQQRLHAWIQWAQREAKRLVGEHWTLVEVLTEELMRRKTLDNHEAREILASVGPLPVFDLQPIDG